VKVLNWVWKEELDLEEKKNKDGVGDCCLRYGKKKREWEEDEDMGKNVILLSSGGRKGIFVSSSQNLLSQTATSSNYWCGSD